MEFVNRRCVLGVDLGTSSCKVRVVGEDGRSYGVGQAPYETLSPVPGWAEQRPWDWLTAVRAAVWDALEEAGVQAEALVGIGLTSAAHIGVLLDEDEDPVRPALLWMDQRSAGEAAELELKFGAEILETSFNRVSTSWTLPHLAWVRRHEPEIWSQVHRVVLSKDFLFEWLTGLSRTDPGTAVSSQFYDARVGSWSEELCGMAGLTVDQLPEVVPADLVGGNLTGAAATALGLAEGTPVVVGSLDSACEMLAAGAVSPGDAVIRLASAGGIQSVEAMAKVDGRWISYPHVAGGYWYRQAGTNACATAVSWGKKLFGAGLSWEEWDEAAASVPAGSEGLLFHPYLAGERAPIWSSEVRGSFTGLGLHHSTGHFARAIYEGTACSIRHAMELFGEAGATGPLSVVGGGAKSRVWLEILSGVLGRAVRPMAEADSALGAALLAWRGLGVEGVLAESGGTIVLPEGVEIYQGVFERYRAVSGSMVADLVRPH